MEVIIRAKNNGCSATQPYGGQVGVCGGDIKLLLLRVGWFLALFIDLLVVERTLSFQFFIVFRHLKLPKHIERKSTFKKGLLLFCTDLVIPCRGTG